ncbi:MAG: hypothetical protein H7Z37_01970 [Pyrinomonadaceae bacterium]|nr:hypothetical protein [Pyrinomonadaceae bacterium]
MINRTRGIWTLTKRGAAQVATENATFQIVSQADDNRKIVEEITHREAQNMLIEIAQTLGFEAQMEFDFYDVVWRTSAKSQRLSHVFEVQHRGNIDSAFAKLKKAHDAQRSKVFLVLSSERDTNRALRSISDEKNGAFHELSEVLTILSFAQIRQIHKSLTSIKDFLPVLLEK